MVVEALCQKQALTSNQLLIEDQLLACESESCSVVSEFLLPHGLYSLWNSPGQNFGVGSCSLFQGIFPIQVSNPGPTLQRDSLPAEPQRKPKNIGEGSLSHLQRIFPTQELNRALLHCRWVLYQLSYQGLTC